MSTAIDWSRYPEPWRSIGVAFRRECEKIAPSPGRPQGRPPMELGGRRIPPVAREDEKDDASSGRAAEPQPAGGLPESRTDGRALQPPRRRATRQPERAKGVVSPEEQAAIDEFLN